MFESTILNHLILLVGWLLRSEWESCKGILNALARMVMFICGVVILTLQ